jgi:hypothetical protein
MIEIIPAVLVAFYLFLAVRWDLVRRPMPYVVGVGAVCVVIFVGVFTLGGSMGFFRVISIFAVLTAFIAGIATCCPMDLPIDPQGSADDEVQIL